MQTQNSGIRSIGAILLMLMSILLVGQRSNALEIDSELMALSAGEVINTVEEAVDDLVEKAFQRLDRSILLAAHEARATINSTRVQLGGAQRTLVRDLDEQQRRIVADLLHLETVIEQDLNNATSVISENVGEVLTNVNLLLSADPGFIRVIPGFAILGDQFIELRIEGHALSVAKLQEFHVNNAQIEPTIVTQDDSHILLRIPLNDKPILQFLETADAAVIELRFRFSVEKCTFFRLFCGSGRSFSQTGMILPKSIGTVHAVWTGEIQDTERVERVWPPFTSSKVQTTKLGTDPGERDDTVTVQPDEGWTIDVDSIEVEFEKLHSGCSSTRSEWTWGALSSSLIRVNAHTESERRFGATCRTRTTIRFTQTRPIFPLRSVTTRSVDIRAGERIVLRLADIENELESARLSHLQIDTSLQPNRKIIVRPGETVAGYQADYVPSSQTVFLNVHYFE